MKILYTKISPIQQHEANQAENSGRYDKTFKDSEKDTTRPQLEKMIKTLSENDSVYCNSFDRLGKSVLDLKNLVNQITKTGADLTFLNENLTFKGKKQDQKDTSNPTDALLFNILNSFALFEKNLIRARTAQGLEKYVEKGGQLGRIPKLSEEQIEEIKTLRNNGVSIKRIGIRYQVSPATIYRALKK